MQGAGTEVRPGPPTPPFDKQAQHSPRARRMGPPGFCLQGCCHHLEKQLVLLTQEAGAGAWGKGKHEHEGAVGCRGKGCGCQQACPRPTVRALTG